MDLHEDILSILPTPSRAKLERLINERELAHAALTRAGDKWREESREHHLLAHRVRQQLEKFQGYEVLAPDQVFRPDAVEQAKTETEARLMEPIRAAERRKEAAREAHERAAQKWEGYAFLGECVSWLRRIASLGAPRFEHFAPPPPKTRDAMAEVQRIRRELESLDEQWRAVEDAPVPAKIIREHAVAEINRIAEAGALELNPYNRSGEPLGLERAIRITQNAVKLPGSEHPDLFLSGQGAGPLLIWLMRDVLVQKVDELVETLPQDGALDDDEREREFARIAEERLRLERIEETLIVTMESEGRFVARRRNADPRAILEISET